MPQSFKWIFPLSALIGAALAAVQPGDWWRSLLVFALLTCAGLWVLHCAWQWAGAGRALAWAMALAFALRLLSAVIWVVFLPAYGYDTPQQNAGYVFYDAFRRDSQSWQLAQSDQPLLMAFSQSYSADQYGGLLAFSALLYRIFSPDAHRALLLVLAAAWAAAVSLAFARKAIAAVWSESLARPAIWLLALYPESVLQGSAQMREPFLIALMAAALWGFVRWRYQSSRAGWGWLALALGGMLLVSPSVAALTLVWLAGWLWLRRDHAPVTWRVLAAAGVVLLAALALFLVGIGGDLSLGGLRLSAVKDWFMQSARWDMLQVTRQSGWVQNLMEQLPEWAEMPFVMLYGLAQPVLPAALIEPSLPIWQSLGIARALGWYVLLPFLVFATLSLAKRREPVWVWLTALAWAWIVASALRAGGDQWDNPRYRVIFLLPQALLFARAWLMRRNPWLARILLMEGIFLLFFGQWYISRYWTLMPRLPFFSMVAAILVCWGLVIAGALAWDAWQRRRRVA